MILYDKNGNPIEVNEGAIKQVESQPEPKSDRITRKTLETMPIPPAAPVKVELRKYKRAGSPAHYDRKLHCYHCGQKRVMRIATILLNTDGTSNLVYFNLRKLQRTLKENKQITLPDLFIGNCLVCLENTPFRVNKNRKLEVQDPSVLDDLKERLVNNERTDPVGGEVPASQD